MAHLMAFLTAVPIPLHGAGVTVSAIYTPLKRRRAAAGLSQNKRDYQRCYGSTPLVATIVKPGTEPAEEVLEQFSAAVAGEWTGYEGRFDGDTAKVQEIPDYYVPDQFLEWGLTPKGFETNHSVIVRGTQLFRKFFRILPTVSLFADHVDTEEEFSVIPLHSSEGEEKNSTAIFSDGCFVAGPGRVKPKRESRLDKWPSVSFCIRDARDGEKRAANIWLQFDFENRAFKNDVRAIVERWSCRYCDGADLEGSSGFIDGWVSETPGGADQLAGDWVVHGARLEGGGATAAAAAREEQQQQPVSRGEGLDARVALFLPQGLDVSIRDADEGAVVLQAGWLVDEGTRVVLRRHFHSDGSVAYSQRVVEQRVS